MVQAEQNIRHTSRLIALRFAQTGQGLTEFALMLPVLLLILLGALDLGRVYNAYVAITNASREGARYGMTHPTQTDAIKTQTQQEAAASGISIQSADISIQCFRYSDNSSVACDAASHGDKIEVRVEFDFQFMTLYLFSLPTVPISNATIMVILGGAA
ncbi:MAG: pilus assembly protein [Chloroflexi bacterium]|nr:pilus assembly protein [Chloroflexota bacterium]